MLLSVVKNNPWFTGAIVTHDGMVIHETNRVFSTRRAAEGEAVATCYQRASKHTPACIIYRVGIQGGDGKVYLSKDTGKTWEKIAYSQYTSGGGMYYLGGSHYSVNYGNAFSS